MVYEKPNFGTQNLKDKTHEELYITNQYVSIRLEPFNITLH